MNNDNHILASLVIFISVLLLLLLNYSVFYIPNIIWAMPWLSTIGVFFWVVFAKNEFGFGQAFLLGIIEDIIVGTAIGFHALALIVMYRLALQQRKYLIGKPFKVIWFAYSLSLVFVFVVAFITSTILGNGVSTISPLNWLISILVLPIFHLILMYIRNKWVKK